MRTLAFDTAVLPPRDRLPTFRKGAANYQVDAVGDPLQFSSRWRLLQLGDLNAIRSSTTPVRYRRDRAMIEADGEDRVAIHYYISGSSEGVLGDDQITAVPGCATVWDLSHPLDLHSKIATELLIVTLPRYMLDEMFSVPMYGCVLGPSPQLALAADQLLWLIDHAEDLPDDGAPHYGRAVRDLFAVAMHPVLQSASETPDPAAEPLFRRMCKLIDEAADRTFNEAAVASALDAPLAEVRRTADRFGGLPLLIERRRLLAAYRLLCDPGVAEPVSAIADRCGFSDPSRFSRLFREVFQATPSDLRRFRVGRLPQWAGAYHVEKDYGTFLTR